jgi:predicted RNA methylase
VDVTTDSHWVNWHRLYEIDGSPLHLRLEIVQRHVRDELARRAGGPTQMVSLCAGQGRDVIGALAGNPAAATVHARLVELDPQLVADARAAAADAGLDGAVEIVEGDASTSDCLAGAVPAHVVLACGIFGNISNDDIRDFIGVLPTVCAPGALVVWTRHRRAPDLTPDVRAWFADTGFDEVAFESPDDAGVVAVGVHRLAVEPQPFRPGARWFTFVGDGGVF